MYSADGIPAMAVDAEWCAGHRGAVVMGVSRKIGGVASGACPSANGGDIVFAAKLGKVWGSGVTGGAGVFVYRHGIVCLMAGSHARRGVSDVTESASADGGVIHQAVLSGLRRMTDHAAGLTHAGADDVLDCRAGACLCLSGSDMAFIAGVLVQSEDASPGIGKLGVTVIAVIALGLIDTGPQGNAMAMAMAVEITAMAASALAAIAVGRAKAAVVGGAVTGGAAVLGMDLAATDKRRSDGAMATRAVGGDWCAGRIGLDGSGVVMGMTGKVGRMTEGTVAGTICRCATSVGPSDLDASNRRVAQGAGASGAIAVNINDNVACVAAGA